MRVRDRAYVAAGLVCTCNTSAFSNSDFGRVHSNFQVTIYARKSDDKNLQPCSGVAHVLINVIVKCARQQRFANGTLSTLQGDSFKISVFLDFLLLVFLM